MANTKIIGVSNKTAILILVYYYQPTNRGGGGGSNGGGSKTNLVRRSKTGDDVSGSVK